MEYHDQVAETFKQIAEPLNNLTSILQKVMNKDLKKESRETQERIKKEVEELQPELKVAELRERMQTIVDRSKGE